MGCCVSTPNESITQKQEQISSPPPQSQKKNHHHQNVSKSPPRVEEEAVKEVLSETPTPKPRSPQIPKINKNYGGFLQQAPELSPNKHKNAAQKIPTLLDHKDHIIEEEEEVVSKYPKPSPFTPAPTTTKPPTTTLTPEENSEISDYCSLSEISASTTTLSHAERRGEEDDDQRSRDESEVCQQRVYRSPVKSRSYGNGSGSINARREVVTGRSPVRRSDPSPTGRRNTRTGTGQGSVVMRGGLGVEGNVDGRGQRRDFNMGEKSGRRSRSPAINRNEGAAVGSGGWNRSNNLGRSPSVRKTGPSPARVRMVQPTMDDGKRAEEIHSNGGIRMEAEEERQPEQHGKWPSNTSTTSTTTAADNNNNNNRTAEPTTESLENPLVSLECFIFL